MPETAKILPFPSRGPHETRSRGEILALVESFLRVPREERSTELINATLGDGDQLSTLLGQLWEQGNKNPSLVSQEAIGLHAWLTAREKEYFFFDERDYSLGESALLAGACLRLLGAREDCERWFDRADASFRHTVAPAPLLARVAFQRLSLRFDLQRHDDVLELLPSVALTFKKLGMAVELAKCHFLEAMCLKQTGRNAEAAERLDELVANSGGALQPTFLGLALVNLGDLRSGEGQFARALEAYREATSVLESANQKFALADLKMAVGATLRTMGLIAPALAAYREAADQHAELGMVTRAAYARVVFADALLEAGKHREAEWQLLAALPTIDEQKMVPEGFAAVALLRESVRQRKTDPKALLELREYLQAKN
ncbi:MAG TPA: hypothetical protein VKG23_08350 [Thermoanaerobaculia bacterium]|nr:hypothetical protein [Thermoanaerobaculia bacterium]